MKIGLYHGYELMGSGSNEYTRYLADNLIKLGHEVHVICREPHPEKVSFIDKATTWSPEGSSILLFDKDSSQVKGVLHQLPHGPVRPVYVTDKQRSGNVKAFVNMTDAELDVYHTMNDRILRQILAVEKLDILHANHVIYQPIDALEACKATGTRLVIYPHGSSIEYVVKADERFYRKALHAILECEGLIIGNREVRDRIVNLYQEHAESILSKTQIVGVGVDTSLFRPVPKSERQASIDKLIATNGKGGKEPRQSQELIGKLDKLDIEAVRGYWDAYNHSLPDEDLNEKLADIPWDEHILLFVGAFTAGKGLQSLIVGLPEVLRKYPDTHLVIVGAGAYREVLEGLVYAIQSGSKKLLDAFCERGMELDRSEIKGPWVDVQRYLQDPQRYSDLLQFGQKLAGHVHFTGRLNHDRLQYLFPCADLAVFPSVVPEAYPLVLMESLANGVIPVVSYFSGFRDGVDELEPIIGTELTDHMKISLDPETRIPSIIDNLCALLGQEKLRSDTGKLREIAVDEYDWHHRAAQLVEAYENIE